MIQNLKLYVTLNGSGSYALKAKLWTRSSTYEASVPVPGTSLKKIKEMKSFFSSIRPNFTGLNEEDWLNFDKLLEQLAGNNENAHPAPMLAMSLASARAATNNELWKIKGPANKFPYIIGIAVNGSAWRDFMLIPHRESNIMDAFSTLLEAWKVVGEELKERGVLRGRSASGAWLSDLGDTETLFLLEHIARDWNMVLGIDVGASHLWDGKFYDYSKNRSDTIKASLTNGEQMSLLEAVMEQYSVAYVEDPFNKTEFTLHTGLSQKFENTIIAGGDLYELELSRIKKAHKYRSTKAIAVNPENLSTVSQLSRIFDFT
ncbi:MAG: hypothetical protein JSV63_02030, partial [Candidatus Aenigmatarchaeota archaeon]